MGKKRRKLVPSVAAPAAAKMDNCGETNIQFLGVQGSINYLGVGPEVDPLE